MFSSIWFLYNTKAKEKSAVGSECFDSIAPICYSLKMFLIALKGFCLKMNLDDEAASTGFDMHRLSLN